MESTLSTTPATPAKLANIFPIWWARATWITSITIWLLIIFTTIPGTILNFVFFAPSTGTVYTLKQIINPGSYDTDGNRLSSCIMRQGGTVTVIDNDVTSSYYKSSVGGHYYLSRLSYRPPSNSVRIEGECANGWQISMFNSILTKDDDDTFGPYIP